MAILYRAELRPTKLELVAGWLPTQPWFEGNTDAGLVSIASFRFDDPEGEVGIETLLVRVGDGPVLQVPLTYRGAPLNGGDASLIGTMQHSVLGQRWVYDAAGDPAYLAALATAALTGGSHADQYIDTDGQLILRAPTALVVGSRTNGVAQTLASIESVSMRNEQRSTVVMAGLLRLVILRVLTPDGLPVHRASALAADDEETGVLTGTWSGQLEPQPLALVLAF
ncbi:CG0192-related protein [Pengzhenrongella phosphoraccumulans]|uniref:CG0192-related protein n=1 Tax=Pengzhenrongella phosphoraccumulans TaxID=3114394 RepID=UPI00388EA0DC